MRHPSILSSRRFRLRSCLVLTALLLLAAPVISRITSEKTLRTWHSTPGALGLDRPLTLTLERRVAYVDLLGLYPSYSLLITDGGYAYVHRFQIPSAEPAAFVQKCQVAWDREKVSFTMPDGETLMFPASAVIQQTGP